MPAPVYRVLPDAREPLATISAARNLEAREARVLPDAPTPRSGGSETPSGEAAAEEPHCISVVIAGQQKTWGYSRLNDPRSGRRPAPSLVPGQRGARQLGATAAASRRAGQQVDRAVAAGNRRPDLDRGVGAGGVRAPRSSPSRRRRARGRLCMWPAAPSWRGVRDHQRRRYGAPCR